MSEQFWQEVWSVLVEECGATEERSSGHGFDSFYRYMLEDHDWYEFRFMGHLGFGGKFKRTWADTFRVDCYPEDDTPALREMIDRANDRLSEMAVPA